MSKKHSKTAALSITNATSIFMNEFFKWFEIFYWEGEIIFTFVR
jgi:hypothetical protein